MGTKSAPKLTKANFPNIGPFACTSTRTWSSRHTLAAKNDPKLVQKGGPKWAGPRFGRSEGVQKWVQKVSQKLAKAYFLNTGKLASTFGSPDRSRAPTQRAKESLLVSDFCLKSEIRLGSTWFAKIIFLEIFVIYDTTILKV